MILGGRKVEGPIFEWLLQISAFSTRARKKNVLFKNSVQFYLVGATGNVTEVDQKASELLKHSALLFEP